MWKQIQALALRMSGTRCVLPGRWERQGDAFAGCIIEIPKASGPMVGTIRICPSGMKEFGWREGDLKWKEITESKPNHFDILDLHKEYDRDSRIVLRTSYARAELFFVSEDTFIVSHRSTYQTWRRVGMQP